MLLTMAGLASAAAHEVEHELVRGKALAVRAAYADGTPLAGAAYQVFAPGEAMHQQGVTDADGWLSFVPSAVGEWRLRVADVGGHGFERRLAVDAEDLAGACGEHEHDAALSWLRPLVGALVIAAVFSGLWLYGRRST